MQGLGNNNHKYTNKAIGIILEKPASCWDDCAVAETLEMRMKAATKKANRAEVD